MSEPLPHHVEIAKKLRSLGVDDPADPQMFILGANLVTAEIDARNALRKAAGLAAKAADLQELDDFDAEHLTDTAAAITKYQRARRAVITFSKSLAQPA